MEATNGAEILPDPPISAEELARRDEALLAYYREWSAIARASIKDARLLRKLGLGKRGRPKQGAAAEPVE